MSPAITGNPAALTFAIDGALAEARTGAFFGNNQAPLTSRTIQFISQTTITQREVESVPSITDPASLADSSRLRASSVSSTSATARDPTSTALTRFPPPPCDPVSLYVQGGGRQRDFPRWGTLTNGQCAPL